MIWYQRNYNTLETMIYRKTCEWCGNEFIAHKSNTRFCSKRCTDHSYKDYMRTMTQNIIEGQQNTPKTSNEQNCLIMNLRVLGENLGVSRMTAYRYVVDGIIPAVKARGRIKVRRSDLDRLFENVPQYEKLSVQKSKQSSENGICIPKAAFHNEQDDSRYTTAKEVSQMYDLSPAGADKVLKQSGITVVRHRGKHYYFKAEVEALFKKREAASHPEITEWYTAQEVQEKFHLKPASVWDIVSTYKIPSKKIKRKTYYSKIHFDLARGIKSPELTEWYTVAEAMEKYGQTRDQVYTVLRYNNVERVQVGRIVKFKRSDYDELMRFAVKPIEHILP